MNISDIFKQPTVPQGKSNKRKLPIHPDDQFSTESRHLSYEELTGKSKPTEDPESSRKSKSARREDVGDEVNEDDENNDHDDEGGRFFGDGLTEEHRRILELVDAAEQTETETLNVAGVKKMLLRFEKALSKNTELRVKFVDNPAKFMESEADLDEEIKNLMTLTQAPQHYPTIVHLGSDASIISLLGHENTDIAVAAVELLNELTDEDVLPEDEEGEKAVRVFVDSLIQNQVLEILVQNLTRLDESIVEDRQGVFHTLGVIENFASFDPKLCDIVVARTDIMKWLVKRIQTKAFDSNKQYASEILSILLQSSRPNRFKLVEVGGMDVVLKVLSSFRKKDPKDDDETEFMENIFDTLCSMLGEPELKTELVKAEGIELMLIMLKEKKMSRMRSLKVLDFACSTKAGTGCCERFVDALGLKTLFAAFMGKGTKKLKKEYRSFSETEEEEHLIGIVGSLLRNLSSEDERRSRLLSKFTEGEHEKVDRLLELREGWMARVAAVDQKLAERNREEDDEEEEEDERDLEEDYLTRLESGLFALQMLDLILAVVALEVPSAREHARMLLSRRNQSFDDIKKVLQEYADNLGEPMVTDKGTEKEDENDKEKDVEELESVRVKRMIAELL